MYRGLIHRYCCIGCLDADRDSHANYCIPIALKKGRRVMITPDEARRKMAVLTKARLFDDDGNYKQTRPVPEEHGKGNSAKPGQRPKRPKRSKKVKRKHKLQIQNLIDDVKLRKGSFGGPVKTNDRELKGVSFGDGWWKRDANEHTLAHAGAMPKKEETKRQRKTRQRRSEGKKKHLMYK